MLEPLGADGGQIHQADGLVVAAELGAHRHVPVERGLHDLVVDLDVLELVPKVVWRQWSDQ